jgi:sugar/nucleoside kinase (ribokinase family)
MKKVLGIGNALVDVILFLGDDRLLATFDLPRGSMQLVDAVKARQVEDAARDCKKHRASGGSAANTIHGLAKLGIETTFIGTVGRDALGEFFENDLRNCFIRPVLTMSSNNTGRAISLVSPGGERTMATFLGAAVELSVNQIDPEVFCQHDHLHLEGYLVPHQSLVEKALEQAGRCGMTVSLDLGSYNVVEANLPFLKSIVTRFKPIVFANEEEARVFTGQPDPQKSLSEFSKLCETAIVKTGARGSLICHRGKYYQVGALPVNCIDTTGAGDLYAAGFLYGHIRGLSPDACGRIGSLLAGKVIEEPGAKIGDKSWDYIRRKLNEY